MAIIRRILSLVAFGALAASSAASAHDFWIDAIPWSAPLAQDSVVEVGFSVGHAGAVKPWSPSTPRTVSMRVFGPDGAVVDATSFLAPAGRKGPHGGPVGLAGSGLHLIAFETDEAFSDLPAEKFDAYVREEGLALIADAREDDATSPGRELYSRRAKALLAIGAAKGAAPRAIGQTLEVVALDNPHALSPDAPIRLRIDYEGAPLAGAVVKFESLDIAILPPVRRKTDASGVVAFAHPKRGAWKASVVWSRPIADNEPGRDRAEFRTVFSSLTFGY
jgi:uncharacterized GH25 family protein